MPIDLLEGQKGQVDLLAAKRTPRDLLAEPESLLKSTAKGFAKGGATFVPKGFWGGAKLLKDVANEYPAFTPWAAGTQFIPEDYLERQLAEVEKTAEYLTPKERKGWTKYIPKAAETLGQMAGSAVSTAGVGTLPAMAISAGVDKAIQTQKEGYSLPKSLVAGGMSTVAEYVPEVIPFKYLTKIGLPYLQRIAGGLAYDVPGEIITQFTEMKSIDEGLLGKKYTPQEYAKAILDTAATSALTTGIATTAVQPFKQMPPKRPLLPEEQETIPPPTRPPRDLLAGQIKPLQIQQPQKQEVFLPEGEKPLVPPRDLLIGKAMQPLPKPENIIVDKPTIQPTEEIIKPLESSVSSVAPVVSEEINKVLSLDEARIQDLIIKGQGTVYRTSIKDFNNQWIPIGDFKTITEARNAIIPARKTQLKELRNKSSQPKVFTPPEEQPASEAAPIVSKEPKLPLHKEILDVAQTENIFKQIRAITSSIKINKSLFDHFDKEEILPIVRRAPGLFSKKENAMSFDEVADGLGISTDELADKMRNARTKTLDTEILTKQIKEYSPPLPSVTVGDLGLNIGYKFKIHGEQYTVKQKDAEGHFLIEDGDKFVVDEFGFIPQPDEGSIQKGKGKYIQPKMLEGEKTDIAPKMEAEVRGQQKMFNPKGEIVKEPSIDYSKPSISTVRDASSQSEYGKPLENRPYEYKIFDHSDNKYKIAKAFPIELKGFENKQHFIQENPISKRWEITEGLQTQRASGNTKQEAINDFYKYNQRSIPHVQETKEIQTTSRENLQQRPLEEIKGQELSSPAREDIVSEPSTNLETFGFQSMYEAGEKLTKNVSEYVQAQREYKKILKEGGVTEDIPHDIGKFKQFVSFPHTVAKRFPKTKVLQDRTYQQVEQFENVIGDLKDNLDPYIKAHDVKVDTALIDAYVRPQPAVFSEQELRARGLSDIEVKAYKAVGNTMADARNKLSEHLIKIGNDPQEVQAWIARLPDSYIPLSRFGNFYVSVKDSQGNGITTPTFDNVGQARRAVVDLKRQYPDSNITMGNVKRLAPEAYEGMPLNVLAFLSQFDENLSANFAAVIGKGFPGHLLQVKKTPGFETNLKKSLSDYTLSLARYISINEYKRDITNMLDYEKSKIVDPKREAGLWGYWKRYSDYIISNPKEFAKFRQFFYYYYLGANIKSALLNATQPLTTTYPVLSKYAKQPEMLMAKAFKLASHTQKGLMKINPELGYAVQSAIHDGTISEQNINELRGLQQGKSASKIGNILSFLFSSAEKYNRKVSFIAMFLAGREGYLKQGQPRTHAELQKLAEDFTLETQFDYRKVNRPELARGWRAPLFTFRMFSGNYLSMLKNLMVEKEFAAIARSLGVMLILGGVSAIPGWKELEKALELMGYDPKKSFREYMGKEQGELALHGLPFKTGGNISGALGTIELLPGDIQQGVTAGIANLVLGVPVDIPKRFDRARQYLFKLHSPYRAVEAVMPEFVRNPMVAIRWIREEGIRSPKYEKMGTATNKDIFFKAIGIQPSNLTNIYEQKHSSLIIKNRATRNSEEYNFRLAKAIFTRDIAEYKSVVNEIVNHNKNVRSSLDLIIPDKGSVQKQLTGMMNSNIKDMKEMPKRGRGALKELQEIY